MAVVSREVDESPVTGAFFGCAKHAQQPGGASPLSNLMVVTATLVDQPIRTAVCGPVRKVVWEGRAARPAPIPILRFAAYFNAARAALTAASTCSGAVPPG
jgi:hypothetical protein